MTTSTLKLNLRVIPMIPSNEGLFLLYLSLLTCAILYIVTLSIQLLSLLFGTSFLYRQATLTQVVLHAAGFIGTVWFILMEWHARSLWNIWIPFGYSFALSLDSPILYWKGFL